MNDELLAYYGRSRRFATTLINNKAVAWLLSEVNWVL